MGKLRFGLVGLGFMGQGVHLQNFLHVADCEVAAVADVRADLVEGVVRRYGIPRG